MILHHKTCGQSTAVQMTTCFKTDGSRRLMATAAYHRTTTSPRAPRFGTRVHLMVAHPPSSWAPRRCHRSRPGRPCVVQMPATNPGDVDCPSERDWTMSLTRQAPVGREERTLFRSQHLPRPSSWPYGPLTCHRDDRRHRQCGRHHPSPASINPRHALPWTPRKLQAQLVVVRWRVNVPHRRSSRWPRPPPT